MLEADERLRSLPRRFRGRLAEAASGALPPNVALMHILVEAADAEEARAVLAAAREAFPDGPAAARLRELARLGEQHPDAFTKVKAVLARVVHNEAPDGVHALASAFDQAVSVSPDASVALYTLGSPVLLEAATKEIVEALRAWRLLGLGRTMLEIGCGTGRFEEALAPELRLAVGTDISAAMLAEARRRCAGMSNAAFLRTSGLDLAAFADGSFELVLAVDSFPYLVQAGPGLAARHIEEAARVLKSGGDLLILNLSYRGDLARDRADIAAAAGSQLRLVRDGERPFRLWDGVVFHLAKPPAEPT